MHFVEISVTLGVAVAVEVVFCKIYQLPLARHQLLTREERNLLNDLLSQQIEQDLGTLDILDLPILASNIFTPED